ncbi:MAG: TolC family outer membrane protein [Magnetovibrionaceae bacterium]
MIDRRHREKPICRREQPRRAAQFAPTLGLCLALGWWPGAATAEGLFDALGDLWTTHPQIRSAEKDLLGSRSDVDRELSGYWPRVSVTGDWGIERIETPSRTVGDPSQRSPVTAGLSVTQNIFNGFSTASSVRAARFNTEVARSQLAGTRQATLFDGVQAYVDVLRQMRLVELAKANEATIQLQLDLEDERVSRGSGVAVDVIQAKSRLQTAIERRIEFEGAAEDALTRYFQVFGRRPDVAQMTDPPLPTHLIPTQLRDAIQLALKNNPAVANSQATIEATRATRWQSLAGYSPQVDVVASANYEKNSDGTIGTRRDYSVLVQSTWDLFNGFETKAQVERATFDYRAAKDNHDFVRSRVEEQVRIGWQALLTARARLQVQENAVNIASELFTSRRKLREAGRETVVNVLDAENEIFNAQINYTSAAYDEISAVYELLLAMGRLDAANLNLNAGG